MKFKKFALGALVALAVAGTAGWFSLDKETRGLLKTVPTNRDLLFWTEPQRDAAFRALDRLPVLAKWRVVAPSATPTPLPPGPPIVAADGRARGVHRRQQRTHRNQTLVLVSWPGTEVVAAIRTHHER